MKIRPLRNRRGIVLFAVLAVLAALALLAGTLAVLAVSDIRMASQFKHAVDALYAADSGVQWVKARIQSDLASGSLTLGGSAISVNYVPPADLNIDPVQVLLRTGDTNAYAFQVTGRSGHSRDSIEVVFRRGSVFDLGVFGDVQVDTKAYGNIYTYDSTELSSPTGSNSLGGAKVASNGDFLSHQDTLIDGSFELGEDALGNPGDWRETPEGGTLVTGESAVPAERIDPDPLGALSGDLADDFVFYSNDANNNNDRIAEMTGNNDVKLLGQNQVLDLPSGNYFIHDLIIGNGASLNIIATNGPVNIYLTGKLEAKEGSTINCTGDPPDLSIFSNSEDALILKNQGDFRGLIYAPYAPIHVLNSADFLGVAWGESVELKNSGDVYIDVALMNEYPDNRIRILSWKELRD